MLGWSTESFRDARMYMSKTRAYITKTNSVQKAGTGIRLDMHAKGGRRWLPLMEIGSALISVEKSGQVVYTRARRTHYLICSVSGVFRYQKAIP